MGRLLIPLAAIATSVTAFLAFRPDDLRDWFPMELGDRWTYRDAGHPEPVVFEVVRAPAPGLFEVERRARGTSTTFRVSLSGRSVRILGTSKGTFDPPLEEFRLPPRAGERWVSKGAFGRCTFEARIQVEDVGRGRCRIREDTRGYAYTIFELERGKGVVRLTGKEGDVHNFGDDLYDWTLVSFERK